MLIEITRALAVATLSEGKSGGVGSASAAARSSAQSELAERDRQTRAIQSRFNEFDADSDGQLNESEWIAAIADTGLIISKLELLSLREAAASSDGRVDLQSWTKFGFETLIPLLSREVCFWLALPLLPLQTGFKC